MRTAVCNAAKRGVDVRIVTPGIPDKKTVFRLTRSNYAPLLKAGVKIYEYTPGFIHAKSMSATTNAPSSGRSISITAACICILKTPCIFPAAPR